MTTNNSDYMRAYREKNRAKLKLKDREYQQKHRLRYRLRRLGLHNDPKAEEVVRTHSGKCDICGNPGDGRWK